MGYGFKQDSCVNVAILADAQKKNAVEDALDGFVELVTFQQIGPIVVADKIETEFAAGFVQEIQKLHINRTGAVGFESAKAGAPCLWLEGPLEDSSTCSMLPAAILSRASKFQISCGAEQGKLAQAPGFPKAGLQFVPRMRFAAYDVDFEFVEISQVWPAAGFCSKRSVWP